MQFFQLNTQSAYDFNQSIVLPDDYAQRAKALGYQGIAIADENPYGFPSFMEACQKEKLKGILGYRIRIHSHNTIPLSGVLYIKNEEGYLTLMKLLTRKSDTYTLDILNTFHEGLSFVLDCENSFFHDKEFLTLISPLILSLSKIYKDDFRVGITLSTKEDRDSISVLYEYCDNCHYKTIAFPHVCYLKKTDAYSLQLLQTAIRKELLTDPMDSGPYFLLSPNIITQLYREKDIAETECFVQSIDFAFFKKRGSLPIIKNANEKLKEKAETTLKERLKTKDLPSDYQARLDYELDIIRSMNFSSYFIIVEDYVCYAKQSDIKVGPGRGSAGGSLVAYALRITDVDPLKFDLSFERFLNPKRVTMPDIDVDFEDTRRNELIPYLKNRYSEENVSLIRTFVKLKPRSALKLIGPALNFNENRLNGLTKLISDDADTFEKAKQDEWYGPKLCEKLQDEYFSGLVEKAKALLRLPINVGFHAPGAIISADPIALQCPLSEKTKGIVNYEYKYMEELGYLKVDILPLSNLSFIKKIEQEILADGYELPYWNENLDDEATFDIVKKGYLSLVFQFESNGMRETIKKVQPDRFTELAAVTALFRPGPKEYIDTFARRKKGLETIHYEDNRLEPILKETFGIMIYQEQIMKAVQVLAGFSAGDADLLRRAISKKKLSQIQKYKEDFLKGCSINGIERARAERIYIDIEKFADYGFNKSHAIAYTMISYRILYLKAHYPQQFYRVALKDYSFGNSISIELLSELSKQGYTIHGPEIQHSEDNVISFVDKDLYLPLKAIFGLSVDAMSCLSPMRKDKTTIHSFYELVSLLSSHNIKKETISSMIKSGLLDCYCPNRKAMLDRLDSYLDFAAMDFAADNVPALNPDCEENIGERLMEEKNTIGLILSDRCHNHGFQKGYRTMIVSDTSSYFTENKITIEDGFDKREIQLQPNTSIKKYDFVLIKADFTKHYKLLRFDDLIIIGERTNKNV